MIQDDKQCNEEELQPVIEYYRRFYHKEVIKWAWRCNLCQVGLFSFQTEAEMLMDLLTHTNSERHKINIKILDNNLRGGNGEYWR